MPDIFDVAGAGEDDLYRAMDWLYARQGVIEKKLAARHLREGGLVLYDLSSSYHRLENRVRAHLFLCMLSYYVKWHMMEAWWLLIFADEEIEAKKSLFRRICG